MKRKIFTSLAVTAVLTCTVLTAAAVPRPVSAAAPTHSAAVPAASMTAQELTACRLVNEIRIRHGLQPFTVDPSLSAKARIKSADMSDSNYFSHNSPTYGSPFSMMRTLGISYTAAAENIAGGFSSAGAVVNAWMSSKGHRNNILSTSYTTMGIGVADGYWTQWFIR